MSVVNLHKAISSTRTDYGSTSSLNKINVTVDESSGPSSNDRSEILRRVSSISNGDASIAQPSETRSIQLQYKERVPTFVVLSGNQPYSRMTVDTMPNSETRQILQRLELSLNVLNQICIGFVTIYLSWMLLRIGLSSTTTLHAWLVTIGFSFLMAEGVMIHYGNNVLTNSYKRTTKTTIHWILLTVGGGCGASGALIKMIQKGFLLTSIHGKLGFTAFILCVLAMLSGLGALFSTRIKRLITPLLNKTLHNFIGIAAFAIALVAQFYGYETGYFKHRTETDFQILMKCLTLISLVLSLIGPLKALYHKSQNIAKHFN